MNNSNDPHPLRLGPTRVYHWGFFRRHLGWMTRVESDMVQVVIEGAEHGRGTVCRLFSSQVFGWARGDPLELVGLAELETQTGFFFCSMANAARGYEWTPLDFWLNSIPWTPDGYGYFGIRGKEEAKAVLRDYYTAVARICLERQGVPEPARELRAAHFAEEHVSRWRIRTRW